MKTLFIPLFIMAFLTSCTIHVRKPSLFRTSSEKVLHSIPETKGVSRTGTHHLYSYTVYDNSVVLIPLSHLVEIEQAYVFDLNKDGYFDSTWVLYKGEWQFRTTLDYISLPSTLDVSVFTECIRVSSYARTYEKRKREAAPKQKKEIWRYQEL